MKYWVYSLLVISLMALGVGAAVYFSPQWLPFLETFLPTENPEDLVRLENLLYYGEKQEFYNALDEFSRKSHTAREWTKAISVVIRIQEEDRRNDYMDLFTKRSLEDNNGTEQLNVLRAYTLLRSGRYQEAADISRKLIRTPHFDSIVIEIELSARYGDAIFGTRGMADLDSPGSIGSEEIYQILFDTLPDAEPSIVLNYSLLKLLDDQFEEALSALSTLDVEGQGALVQAYILYDQELWTESLDVLLSDPSLENDNDALVLLADLSIKTGNVQKAYDYLEMLNQRAPGKYRLGYINLGYYYMNNSVTANYPEAVRVASEGLQYYSGDPLLASILVEALVGWGEDKTNEARDEINKISLEDPALSQVLEMRYFPEENYNLNRVWQLRNDYPEDENVLEFLAWSLIKEQRFTRAISLLLSQEEKEYGWINYYLAIAEAMTGNFSKSLEYFEQIPVTARDSFYYFNRALVESRIPEYPVAEVVNNFEKALSGYLFFQGRPYKAKIHTQLAVFLVQHADSNEIYERALENINLARQLSPEDPAIGAWMSLIQEMGE